MASTSHPPVAFSGSLASKTSASDLLRSSRNDVCGVPLKALGRARLGSKRRDFAVSAKVRKVKKHEYPWPEDPNLNVKGGVLSHLSPFKPLKEKQKPVTLDFEKPLMDLQKKIIDVQKMANETGLDFSDQIISLENKYQQEPLGGAHADPYWTSQQMKTAIEESMDELTKVDTQELLRHRMLKFRKLGGFQEGVPIDPKRKVNMKKKEEPLLPPGTPDMELMDEVEKLKQEILKAKESSGMIPESGLNELIEKLRREIDYEFSEAAKAFRFGGKVSRGARRICKNKELKRPINASCFEGKACSA